MPLILIRNDITTLRCDAIVNAANPSLLGGGGVDGAIHAAAGPELLAECRTLGGCETGQAKITGAYRLPCKYVIHTVGPIWQDGRHGEAALLQSCYLASLRLAAEAGCESVAFPLISAGAYGYPKAQALRIARQSILSFLQANDLTVYLVLYRRGDLHLEPTLDTALAAYLSGTPSPAAKLRKNRLAVKAPQAAKESACLPQTAGAVQAETCAAPLSARPLWDTDVSLGEYLSQRDESFTEMLLRKIDESGITDAACYKKANVDRKLFSKIRSDVHYRPSKMTAIAFALALELSQAETDELLRKAGYALSGSSLFDRIIRFFLVQGNYDIFQINEALFAYDQPLLGG